jgi:adenylate cyclase
MQDIQRYIRYALSITVTVFFLLHVGGFLPVPVLNSMENQAYDARLSLTLPPIKNKQVVIVDIDEKSLGEIGRWPWNRDVMANIVNALFEHYHIKEIGFDAVFAEADIDEGGKILEQMSKGSLAENQTFQSEYQKVRDSLQRDRMFAKSLSDRKTIMGFVLDTDTFKGKLPEPVARLDADTKGRIPFISPKGYTANIDELQSHAYGGGFFDNPLLDDDGVFRRVPLLQEYDGQLHESLALALARAAIGSPKIELIVETDSR